MAAQCTAIANAMNSKGLTSAQLATQAGSSEKRINDILSGTVKPTQNEFSSIAKVLGLSNNPHDAAHSTA